MQPAKWLTTLLLASVLCCRAQSHSDHSDAHLDGNERLGTVSFATTCAPAVQSRFERAVALLHSFAYGDANAAFSDVAASDPACAIAHWGIAMSFYHQLWEPPIEPGDLKLGSIEMKAARDLSSGSKKERAFIEALSVFYAEGDRVPYASRASAYEKAMADVASRYPNDPEAQVFYALALLSTAPPTDQHHRNQKRASAILEPLFAKYPQHPGVAHYLIHAYDSTELANRGLIAARAYSKIAPSAPHGLHMPSHIFTRLGLWEDSIASNRAARTSARQHGDIGEELHAMDYLVYAYLQLGRNEGAEQVLADLKEESGVVPTGFKMGYAATAMPARYAIENRRWAEASGMAIPIHALPQVKAIALWARAVGSARLGESAKATSSIDGLTSAVDQLRAGHNDYWATQVEIQKMEAQSWLAYAQRRNDDAESLMREAAEKEDSIEKLPVTPGPIVPAREQLGDLLLELNRPKEALKAFEQSLQAAPKRRNGLLGAEHAATLAGDLPKSIQFRAELGR
jgi:tetratricopeptide (TPR) repeat protein